MTVVARRDGSLDDMEMNGTLTLCIADESFRRIKVQLKGETLKDSQGRDLVQLHMNPRIDKELMKTKWQIALKNPQQQFPLNVEAGVLKWTVKTTDQSNIPLSSKSFHLLKPKYQINYIQFCLSK